MTSEESYHTKNYEGTTTTGTAGTTSWKSYHTKNYEDI